ncbi:MAG: hypothetical protein GYA48_06240 [Chloroflexi bacterium]|nr:hypothetical protein [Chloroflexota bacterium]
MTINAHAKSRPPFTLLLAALVSVLAFTVILYDPIPRLIRPVSVAVRYGYTLTAPLVLGALLLAYRPQKWIGALTALFATVVLFGLGLNGLWESVQSEPAVISGLLPWADSSAYYLDALGWLQGFRFGEMSTMRPMFTALLSLLLSLTGKNLQASLAVLTLLTAVSAFFYGQKVKETLGFFPAALALLLVFLYARRINGATLTENLGLIFALLGYACLLVGAQTRQKSALWLGVFLVSMSLNARPGPFFILIALIAWSGLLVYDPAAKNFRAALGVMAFSTAAALLAFVINTLVQKATAGVDLIPFANFSYALYGLVSGGGRYTQALIDHPELASAVGNERHFAVFQLALEIFKAHPAGVLQGSLKHLQDFLIPTTWYSMYGYVGSESGWVASASRAALQGLGLVSLIAWFRRRRDPVLQLIVLVMLTTLLSVPFVPPSDAHKLRLYAASIPIIALLPAMGLVEGLRMVFPRQRLAWLGPGEAQAPFVFPNAAIYALSLGLVATVLASPLVSRAVSRPVTVDPVPCGEGQQGIVFEQRAGSYVSIWREEEFFLDRLPNVHFSRYQKYLHGLPMDQLAYFAPVEAGSTLLSTVDLQSGKPYWVVMNTDWLPPAGQVVRACGQKEGYLFVVKEVQ